MIFTLAYYAFIAVIAVVIYAAIRSEIRK